MLLMVCCYILTSYLQYIFRSIFSILCNVEFFVSKSLVHNHYDVTVSCVSPRAYKEKRACNSPRAKTLWAEELY